MLNEKFRVRIDGSWTAKEMGELFQSCETIYRQISRFHSQKLYAEINRQTDNPSPSGNNDGRDQVLKVTSVSYSSPGWADFLGAGELTGHLKDFLLGLIDRVIERKDREQSRKLRATEIEAAALENYAKRIEIIDRAYSASKRDDIEDISDPIRQQMLQLVLQASRPIASAIADGRITSIEEVREGGE